MDTTMVLVIGIIFVAFIVINIAVNKLKGLFSIFIVGALVYAVLWIIYFFTGNDLTGILFN